MTTTEQPVLPRINLRWEREKNGYSIRDINIRTGIPLEHIEALESGVVPQSLRGRKLLKSKHAYLAFFDKPTNSKLDVRKRKTRTSRGQEGEDVLKTDVVVPTTSKSIFTGFGLAVGLVLGLKSISFVLDNPAYSMDGMLDNVIEEINTVEGEANKAEATVEPPVDKVKTVPAISTPIATSLVNSLPSSEGRTAKANFAENMNDLASALFTEVESLDEPERPTTSQGPNRFVLNVLESTSVLLKCDEFLLHKGNIKARTELSCEYSQRATIEVEDPSSVEIKHNGKKVKPMGPLDAARRLSFIQN